MSRRAHISISPSLSPPPSCPPLKPSSNRMWYARFNEGKTKSFQLLIVGKHAERGSQLMKFSRAEVYREMIGIKRRWEWKHLRLRLLKIQAENHNLQCLTAKFRPVKLLLKNNSQTLGSSSSFSLPPRLLKFFCGLGLRAEFISNDGRNS